MLPFQVSCGKWLIQLTSTYYYDDYYYYYYLLLPTTTYYFMTQERLPSSEADVLIACRNLSLVASDRCQGLDVRPLALLLSMLREELEEFVV